MSARKKTETDQENPEWTADDFARARLPHEVLPPEALSVFKRTRGPQRAARNVPISIRLSAEVVEHFKVGGPGWQGRIDDALKKAIGRERG